jgi:Ca2+-binding RTX toxin-like protein
VGYVIGTPTAVTGTIRNDDASLSIAATSANLLEGQSGATAYTFTVTRSGDTSVAHSANWAVSGAAVNATDFVGGVLPSGIVSFAVGETSKLITVNVAGDTTIESNEPFTVTLSAPSAGATLGTATAVGTILNDDLLLMLSTASPTTTMTQSQNVTTGSVSTNLSSFTLATGYTGLTYTGSGPFSGTGNDGDNIISGGPDADVLFGKGGKDVLTGGAGGDWFRYDAISDSLAGVARDVITDFISGQDHIDLSRFLDANALIFGAQPFSYIGSSNFSGAGGELRFDAVNQVLAGDTTGSRSASFEIKLNNVASLSPNDLKLS